jgi:hypothetical protein
VPRIRSVAWGWGAGWQNGQHNEHKNYFVPNKFEIIEPNKGISPPKIIVIFFEVHDYATAEDRIRDS